MYTRALTLNDEPNEHARPN